LDGKTRNAERRARARVSKKEINGLNNLHNLFTTFSQPFLRKTQENHAFEQPAQPQASRVRIARIFQRPIRHQSLVIAKKVVKVVQGCSKI
jgi:hypothetical protein